MRVALAVFGAAVLAGCTFQDQLAAARGALDAVRSQQAAEAARDPIRAYYEERNMSEAASDADEIADWCEEVRDRWGDDAVDDSPTYDQVCERLLQLLAPCSEFHGEGPALRAPAVPPAAAALPPAARAAEGHQPEPAPGAVSGELHAGHGVNLSDAARRLEAALWREAQEWASRWTEAAACRDALAEVHYALGASRIRGFQRMLGEIASEDWAEAAYELRSSEWARVVGDRAKRIARTLEEDCA